MSIVIFFIFCAISYYIYRTYFSEIDADGIIDDTENDMNLENSGDEGSDFIMSDDMMQHVNQVYEQEILAERRTKCFFDIGINNEYVGRIIVELYNDIVPKSCANFEYLCENKYAGCHVFRSIKGFCLQTGDFINNYGTGSFSIYGESFPDENFIINHNKKYQLSYANSSADTNGSQFFFTLDALPHLNGKHVVFGHVINQEGRDVIDRMETVFTDSGDRPIIPIQIVRSGILKEQN
jgi:peptidyl-prolyl isomerase D